MISEHDFYEQRLEYFLSGKGRWKVQGYCPGPSVTMVELDTGEKMHIGIDGLMAEEFEPTGKMAV